MNIEPLLKEENFFEIFSAKTLREMGLDDVVVSKLEKTVHKIEEGFLGAIVLNFLSREKMLDGQLNGAYVHAYLFAEAIGIDFSELIAIKDSDRQIVIEKKFDGEIDLYLKVQDIHFVIDSGKEYSTPTELATAYHRTRNKKIQEELANRFLGDAVAIAKSYSTNFKRPLDEITSDAYIGLTQAIDRFDPSYGAKFETFAYRRIIGTILDSLRAQPLLGPGYKMRKALENMSERRQQYLQEYETEPHMEIYKEWWLADGNPAETFISFYEHVVIDLRIFNLDYVHDVDEYGLFDVIENTASENSVRSLLNKEQIEIFNDDLEHLTDREKTILIAYFFEGIEEKEIAPMLGVSNSRVSQLISKVLTSPNYFQKIRKYRDIVNKVVHLEFD